MLQVDEGPIKDTAKVSATAPSGLVRLRLEQEALRANGRAQPASKTHNHHLHRPKESITKSQPPASLPLPYHAKSPAPCLPGTNQQLKQRRLPETADPYQVLPWERLSAQMSQVA